MIHDLLALVEQHEFLTTTSHLMANGHGRRSIDRAVSQGELVRVCRGWVAMPDARQDAVLAVLHRGKLAGPSALASRQTWDAAATRLHVQRLPNSHGGVRTGAPVAQFRVREYMPTGVVTRWRPEQPAGLRILAQLLPARLHHFVADVEPRSEAGIETLSRVRLAPFVRRIDPQFVVPGIARSGGDGRIDLLIDLWLAFEADGDGWHDPGADRIRDQQLILRGFHPVHFGYAQIVHGWPAVEATVRELLRYPPVART